MVCFRERWFIIPGWNELKYRLGKMPCNALWEPLVN